MIRIDCEQNQEEWYKTRAGVFTASKFSEVVTSKGVPSKSLPKYILKLAGETILGTSGGGYNNAAMKWGHQYEPEARRRFAWEHRPVKVETPGFIFKDDLQICGCSPDGDMPEIEEGLEIKCPEKKEIHLGYLIDGALPSVYFHQVQGSMLITGYKAWWFMSYYPGLPPFMLRVDRNDEFIERLDDEIGNAAIQLAMTIKRIKEVAS